MDYILLSLAIITTGGVLALLPFRSPRYSGLLVFFSLAAGTAVAVSPLIQVLFHGVIMVRSLDMGFPIGALTLELDGLSAFFVFIIFVMSLIICFYQQEAIFECRCGLRFWGLQWFFFNLLIAAMVGVVVVQHGLAFLILWEVMSLSSFFLVISDADTDESRRDALYYLLTTHVGAMFLIVGFLFLYVKTGSFNFEDYYMFFGDSQNPTVLVFVLFFIGFAFKAGFIPFHTGLPFAYRIAPSGIGGLMAGVMKKIAFYGILRMIVFLEHPSPAMGYILIFVSLATGLFGILYALAQKDLKGTLAYSSLENAGIIGIGLGVALLGMTYHNPLMVMFGYGASLFHVINHALFKSLLFLASGTIYRFNTAGKIDRLGGLLKKMPLTGLAFFIGSLAAAGLPPFNGFISEFIFFSSLLMGINSSFGMVLITRVIAAAFLALIGGLSVMTFVRSFTIIFLGKPRSEAGQKGKDPSFFMTLPMIFLAILCLFIGLWPEGVLRLLEAPLTALAHWIPLRTSFYINMLETAGKLTRGTVVFLVIASLIIFGRYLLLKRRKIGKESTWGCGYNVHTEKMQYTSSSFSWPIINLLLRMKETVKGPYGYFPKEPISYVSHVRDFVEWAVEYGICRPVNWILGRFSWIQSGHKQHYILYILVMLILSIIGAFVFN